MDDVGDLYRMGECPVHDDERKRWERQFPYTFHAALSATMRKGLERASTLINLPGGAVRCCGIILAYMCNDGGEILSGLRGPANLHLRTKHPFDPLSDLFVREGFAPVELLQPLLDVLAKPRVMVKIMLYKLLNIPVSIAAVLGGDAVQLGLQVGAEMYFHGLENKDFQNSCQ
jgi:hypothetical protein